MKALATLLASLALASAAAAHENFAAGVPGDSAKPARAVDVTIRESDDGTMRFAAGPIRAARGEQLRFVVRTTARRRTSSGSTASPATPRTRR